MKCPREMWPNRDHCPILKTKWTKLFWMLLRLFSVFFLSFLSRCPLHASDWVCSMTPTALGLSPFPQSPVILHSLANTVWYTLSAEDKICPSHFSFNFSSVTKLPNIKSWPCKTSVASFFCFLNPILRQIDFSSFRAKLLCLYAYGILAFDRQVAGLSPTDGVWSFSQWWVVATSVAKGLLLYTVALK